LIARHPLRAAARAGRHPLGRPLRPAAGAPAGTVGEVERSGGRGA
jgi:hypothetical protein